MTWRLRIRGREIVRVVYDACKAIELQGITPPKGGSSARILRLPLPEVLDYGQLIYDSESIWRALDGAQRTRSAEIRQELKEVLDKCRA